MKDKPPFYIVNGRKLPAVTSILSVLAKPALVAWASKEASTAALEFAMNEWDRRTPITDEQFKKWKNTHTVKKEKAGDIGTALHDLMDALLTKKGQGEAMNALTKAAGGEVAGNLLAAACNAIDALGLTLDTPGSMVFSEQHGYAGTFDAIVKRGDKRILVDYKTAGAVYDEMHLQTAAYAVAGAGGFVDSEERVYRAILRLDKKTGKWEWVESPQTLGEDFAVFLAARDLYNWQTRNAEWRKV